MVCYFIKRIVAFLQEKIAMLRENEYLVKEKDKLKHEKQSLLRSKDMAEAQVTVVTKSLEALQKEMKDKEILVVSLLCFMFYKIFLCSMYIPHT